MANVQLSPAGAFSIAMSLRTFLTLAGEKKGPQLETFRTRHSLDDQAQL